MNPPIKLLLVSYYAPPAGVGAGVSMYHLISNLPKGTYAVLTEQRDSNDSSSNLNKYLDCPYYYYSSKGINPVSQEVKHDDSSTAQGKTDNPSLISRPLSYYFRRVPVIRRIGQIIVVARHIWRIVKAGNEAVSKEKPSMIVAYSDSGPVFIASYLLSIKHNIPLSLHFYDLYKGNNLTPTLDLYASLFEPLLLRRAKHIFVMNDLLRDVYISRSGQKKVTVVYNSLPENKHLEVAPQKNLRSSVAYLGSIYWAQESALKELIMASSLLNPKPKITLYTPYSAEYLNSINIFESDDIVFSTCLPEDSVKELEKHDLTFLGLSHSAPQKVLINTSSPIRLCDYLNARVPMLIHAPEESFVIKHAIKHDFAYISTDPQPSELAKVLKEALINPSRDVKVRNANLVAKNYHDPKLSAKIFFDTIIKVS